MRKKLLVVVLILSVLFVFGCNTKKINIMLYDDITKLPLSGEVLVDGQKAQMDDGVLKVTKTAFKIEAPYYEALNVSLSDDTKEATLYVKPSSWIVIECNSQNPDIFLDSDKISNPFVSKDSKIIISPVSAGKHSVSISKQYFKESSFIIDIKPNENSIVVSLEPDEAAISMLINSLIFPSEAGNFAFDISMNGSFNGQDVEDYISGETDNGQISKVKDASIEYSFIGGKPYISGSEVTDEEKAFALMFSKTTIENFLKIKEYLNGLKLKDITNGFLTFYGTRDFEERSYDEEISFQVDDSSVSRVAMTIGSEELNIKLLVTIDIEGR